MIYLALALTAFLSFFIGHFLGELKDILLTIKNRVEELKIAQDKDKPVVTNFADVQTRAEAIAELEKEKLEMLNP
jgi:sporulation protein YlmC with PRC-barrel domain